MAIAIALIAGVPVIIVSGVGLLTLAILLSLLLFGGAWFWRRGRRVITMIPYAAIPRAGQLFLVLGGVILLLALSSGNNLLYLLFAAMFGTFMISLMVSRLMVSRISMSVRYPDRLHAGEAAPLELIVINRKRIFPAISVAISTIEVAPGASASEIVDLGYFPMIAPGSEARMKLKKIFGRRGQHHLWGFRIESRFPFGFAGHCRLLRVDARLLVLPERREWEDLPGSLPLGQGRLESHVRGSGSDLHSIREYQPTDSRRRVDWRATARTGRMMVREFARDDEWRVTVVFDVGIDESAPVGNELRESYEKAIILAASLVRYLNGLGASIRLVTMRQQGGEWGRFGAGEQHLAGLLDRLARLPVAADQSPLPWWRLFGGWHRQRPLASLALFDQDLPARLKAPEPEDRQIMLITAAPHALLRDLPTDRLCIIHLDDLSRPATAERRLA